jgi:glutaredoxin
MAPTPHIEIFHAEICGLCKKALAYFKEGQWPVIAKEVYWDAGADRFVDSENTRELYARCGQVDFVPQIFINGAHIPGWRKLEPMIKSGELDRLVSQPE